MTDQYYQCIGCGSLIQTNDPHQMGYLPPSALEKGIERGHFYCQRCFRLRHYNELQELAVSDEIFIEKLSHIADDQAYVLHLVDIFDMEGSLIQGLGRLIGQQAFSVVVNKMDLLPSSVKPQRIKRWVANFLKKHDLYPQEIFLVSAKRRDTMESLITFIKAKIHRNNIYMVGVTNVGKSTLINQIIHTFGADPQVITTSNFPGTTLDFIELPLTEHHSLYDTPGIVRSSQMIHYLVRKEFGYILPTKMLKPLIYQLNPGQTLFLGGLGRIDYLQGPRMSLTLYVAADLPIHRTKSVKAEAFYHTHLGGMLYPPQKERAAQFPPLVRRDLHLQPDQDIAISGLGWFTVNESIDLSIWLPKGIQYARRDAII